MISRSWQTKRREAALTALDGSTKALDAAKDMCGVPSAKIALASAFILLTTIKAGYHLFLGGELLTHASQENMNKKDNYINLGLSCADVCGALDRGLNGGKSDKLSEPVQKAIEKLTT